MKIENFKKLPGVLSFNRGIVLSDAEMFNMNENGEKGSPVDVIRHGIRGTQNVNEKGDGEETTVKSAEREVSNIQTTDSAKLSEDACGMIVEFSIRFLPIRSVLSACATGKDDDKADVVKFRDSLDDFLDRVIENPAGITEVAARYARNIANGRWLWRNRTIAGKITITTLSGGDVAVFNALGVPMNHFDHYSVGEKALAEKIASALRGESAETIHVSAAIDFGMRGAIEVFPSQNYIDYGKPGKPAGFARSLYRLGHPEKDAKEGIRVMGTAALRDQKVSNALRTIDTWFEGFEELGKPIPVEPMGANLEQQFAYRQKKQSSFDMMKRLGGIDPYSNEGMFVIGCLIRGGVYSEGKEKPAKKEKGGDQSTPSPESSGGDLFNGGSAQ